MALLIPVAGCSSGRGASGPSSTRPGNVRAGSVLILGEAQRQWPVVLAGTTLEGKRLDLASQRGHPLILNIWGSWCSPCRKEAPELSTAYRKLQPEGVAFVGIDVRDDPGSAKAFENHYRIAYPSLVDDGAALLRLRGAASPDAIPTTLVLDARGRIAARIVGALDATTLIGMVHTVEGSP